MNLHLKIAASPFGIHIFYVNLHRFAMEDTSVANIDSHLRDGWLPDQEGLVAVTDQDRLVVFFFHNSLEGWFVGRQIKRAIGVSNI